MNKGDQVRAWELNCPIPIAESADRITLAHGEGARLSRQLISRMILPRFSMEDHRAFEDAARLTVDHRQLAFCTDSHTVTPLFFPGGDLGSLSIYGTVNDLAVAGAKPRWLTLSLIIEEGLPCPILERLLDSAADAAAECGVMVVAGDTKVVPRGAADGLFINTAGIGEMILPIPDGPQAIRSGDCLLVSGCIGSHGISVMCARDDLRFEPSPVSDSRSVIPQVTALRDAVGTSLRAVRDATRGGVSAVLHEWAEECGMTFALRASDIPVADGVRGACELLGLDPLYVANEGTIVAVVEASAADAALHALRSVPDCAAAAVIGQVHGRDICPVTIHRLLGPPQPLDEPSGAPLPRIC